MKSGLALFVLGLAALAVQGAFARVLPPPWCPDLAWLVVIAMGLRWPAVLPGAVLAVALGYGMDLLSGSLMGQHALLRLVSYLAAALAARQLDLSGGLSVGVFVLGMTVFYGVAIVGMLSFFVGLPGGGLPILGTAIVHGFVNVLAAGPVVAIVERVLMRFSDEDMSRRAPMAIGFESRGMGSGGLS